MSRFLGLLDALRPTMQQNIHDETWVVRSGRRDFSHTRRGESKFGSRGNFWTLWSRPQMFSGDLSGGYCIEDGSNGYGEWSPNQRASRGNGAVKFIMGRCLDADGNGVSGAIVQGFLTDSDVFVGQIGAGSDGSYQLGTPYPGTNHYLVAYRAGSPDIAGTTVNTLQGTNTDGS